MLLICDHAVNSVPAGIDLGIAPALLDRHIAVDLGAAALTEALAARLGAPAVLGQVSRLVIDLHRQADHPGLIPLASDGHAIPGNAGADRLARIAAFHAPYHAGVAAAIARHRPRLLVAIHSFTPALETGGDPRPWPVGILYNRDVRAARLAIDGLRAAGFETGDNQPYSGRLLNATLNRHGEGNGIASFSVELRNNEIASPAAVSRWAEILAKLLENMVTQLA
ncbi:MAG: N-formylglutamate amidohydrolase [Sphingomonas sp.]|nr:N-formylglutamate amidohydrolase [Sphingomonas sp.]